MAWFTEFIPEEFVLESRLGQVLPPVFPLVKGEGNLERFWNVHFDWDWRYLAEFQVQKLHDFWGSHSINLDRFPVDEQYWLASYDNFYEVAAVDWVLVDGDIAKMVLGDFDRQDSWKKKSLLLISITGNHFGSYDGVFANYFLISNTIWASTKSYYQVEAWTHRWGRWSILIFERHPDIWEPHSFEDLIKNGDDSFYLFCTDIWRDYVFDRWHDGTDEEVLYAMETVELLDRENDSSAQFLTIWDDLAIAFFRSPTTTPFIKRMYKLLDNPMDLWLDMHDEAAMDLYRREARRRDGNNY